MAKSGVFDRDPAMVAKVLELKKELEKLVKAIVDDDDFSFQAIDQAQLMLAQLKDLKSKKPISLNLHNQHYSHGAVPEEFKCPLSKELMRDPVIISTGLTYDRPFIQKWIKSGNRTCPLTEQVLSHTILAPNHLIREMILKWCKNHGIKLPDSVQYSDDQVSTEAERSRFISLLGKLSSSFTDQKEAAKELRLLTKRMPCFRVLFSESLEYIPQLLSPLSEIRQVEHVHLELQEDLITTLLNISIHDDNKKLVAETPQVVPILMDALRSGTIETKSNAAATLFTLSALDSNKVLIGKLGALKPLIDLLRDGYSLAMKDVASAIFNLCIIHENKLRAVRDGAVRVILKNILDRIHVDELLSILAMLSTNHKAIEEMGEIDAVSSLLNLIRETSCARNKENCIAILYSICCSDRSKWREMREEENKYGTLSELAQSGTSRAKRKACGILEKLNRTINLTHTA